MFIVMHTHKANLLMIVSRAINHNGYEGIVCCFAHKTSSEIQIGFENKCSVRIILILIDVYYGIVVN